MDNIYIGDIVYLKFAKAPVMIEEIQDNKVICV